MLSISRTIIPSNSPTPVFEFEGAGVGDKLILSGRGILTLIWFPVTGETLYLLSNAFIQDARNYSGLIKGTGFTKGDRLLGQCFSGEIALQMSLYPISKALRLRAVASLPVRQVSYWITPKFKSVNLSRVMVAESPVFGKSARTTHLFSSGLGSFLVRDRRSFRRLEVVNIPASVLHTSKFFFQTLDSTEILFSNPIRIKENERQIQSFSVSVSAVSQSRENKRQIQSFSVSVSAVSQSREKAINLNSLPIASSKLSTAKTQTRQLSSMAV